MCILFHGDIINMKSATHRKCSTIYVDNILLIAIDVNITCDDFKSRFSYYD